MADGDLVRILEDVDNPWRMGRHVNHDPRNRNFRALDIPTSAGERRTRPWSTSVTLYQDNTSSCTIHTEVGLMRTQPNSVKGYKHWPKYDTLEERVEAYIKAQELYDPWPGSERTSPRYEGTSSDACPKLLKANGEIREWRWLFGESETREYVSYEGAFGAGTIWLRSMFNVDANGFVHFEPGKTNVAGGHEYRVVYYEKTFRAYLIHNSWRNWGKVIYRQPSRAWIREQDFDYLLKEQGDAHVLVV